MKPALSIILFTTIAGVGQGLAATLAVVTLGGSPPSGSLVLTILWVATALLVIALGASFFHLGHPARAWRAALMWRTSWMSREVIALPAFIAVVAAWALLATLGANPIPHWLPWAVLALAFALWYCTAMIYACIRFIQEWAHPLTVVNYILLGLSSGLVVCGALAALFGEADFGTSIESSAFAVTALAWFTRSLSLRRNRLLKPASTTQSATGINSARVVQKSMGLTGGSFNTREFFHGASAQAVRHAKVLMQVFTFLIPILAIAAGTALHDLELFILAAPLQFAGLVVERWIFFAQARHPQNLYYQVVS